MLGDFKPFFKRGLAALLPTIVTIGLLMWAYHFVDENFAKYITRGLVSLYAWGGEPHRWLGIDKEVALEFGDPIDEWDPVTGRRLTAEYKAMTARGLALPQESEEFIAAEQARRDAMWELATRKWRFFSVIGFLIAALLIYILGYFLASFVGRTTWLMVERMVQRIPVIGAIYPNIKKVTDFFMKDKALGFSGVVAVQYPRKGIWSVGLVTGPAMWLIDRDDPRDLITVFIPSSPTPVTGYTITVAHEDVVDLPMTIDDALRYTISGGVVTPSAPSETREALAVS